MAPTDGLDEIVLGHADIPQALELSDEARWNQIAADWAIFIDHGECYGLRAEDRLVASAAILPFGGFGWISMVLVTAAWRRRGLASHLMNRCITALRARGCGSMLDATPEGAPVYAQLGFRSCCGMARWRGMGLGGADRRPTALAERQAILGRDEQVFGGDRGFLVKSFLERRETAIIGDERDFVICRRGRRATQIGPLVAESDLAATDLLLAALEATSGPVIIDVLDAGAILGPTLSRHGFEAFRTFERMVLDRDGLPGEPSLLRVAAGPEFG